MKEDIENILYPESGKLMIKKDQEITAVIIDAELDPVNCEFNNDDCVKINTDKLEWVTLSRENINDLLDLLDEAEKEHKKNSNLS